MTATPVPLELHGLRTVIYPAPDVVAAKAWWTGLLGIEPYFDEPYYVGYEVAGYELALSPAADPADGALVHWGVDDVPAAVERVVVAGGEVHTSPQGVGGGIVTAMTRSPAGSLLGVIFNPHPPALTPPRAVATRQARRSRSAANTRSGEALMTRTAMSVGPIAGAPVAFVDHPRAKRPGLDQVQRDVIGDRRRNGVPPPTTTGLRNMRSSSPRPSSTACADRPAPPIETSLRFLPDGLLLLDEPEAALSPQGVLALVRRLRELELDGAQIVAATHSPLLLAYPGARLYELSERGIEETAWEDTDHVRLLRAFLDAPERFLRELFA